MLTNLLMYRLLIFNGCGIALVIWASMRGYLDYLARDSSGISYLILAVFAVGMFSVMRRSLKVTAALNAIKNSESVDINRVKFVAKGSHIDVLGSVCVGLGFFGTVVGIISMLFSGGGITSDGSASGIAAIIDQILAGGGIAFITTAVGLLTSLWLEMNMVMLTTATTCMLEDADHA